MTAKYSGFAGQNATSTLKRNTIQGKWSGQKPIGKYMVWILKDNFHYVGKEMLNDTTYAFE